MEGIFIARVHPRITINGCSTSNEYPYEPRHLPEFVWDFSIGWATVPGAPNLITTAPMVLPSVSNGSG